MTVSSQPFTAFATSSSPTAVSPDPRVAAFFRLLSDPSLWPLPLHAALRCDHAIDDLTGVPLLCLRSVDDGDAPMRITLEAAVTVVDVVASRFVSSADALAELKDGLLRVSSVLPDDEWAAAEERAKLSPSVLKKRSETISLRGVIKRSLRRIDFFTAVLETVASHAHATSPPNATAM